MQWSGHITYATTRSKEKKKQKETKDTEDAKKKSTSRSNCHVFLLFLP